MFSKARSQLVMTYYSMVQINHSPPPISESTWFIIVIHIPRLRSPGIRLIWGETILPDPLGQRLGQVKGPDDLHLTLVIFSSYRLYRIMVFTGITNPLPERSETVITFLLMSFIGSQMAFLTFGLYWLNFDLISSQSFWTAVLLVTCSACFFWKEHCSCCRLSGEDETHQQNLLSFPFPGLVQKQSSMSSPFFSFFFL